MAIDDQIRQLVRHRAKNLCEYCHSPERSSSDLFTLDHLIPKSLGESDQVDNLALACRRCNERRYNFVSGVDPETGQAVPLFNPRSFSQSGVYSGIQTVMDSGRLASPLEDPKQESFS